MSNRPKEERPRRKRAKRLGQQLSVGGTVTLATVGLSTCNDNGSVDPPPPPLNCVDLSAGQSFVVSSASLAGLVVTVEMDNVNWRTAVATPTVTDLQNLTLASIDHSGNRVTLSLTLDSDTTTSGQFTLSGRLRALDSPDECSFTRTFTVTVSDSDVEVAQRGQQLPLANREAARIELVRRNGLEVRLRATGASSEWPLVWTVTAGSLRVENAAEVVWELPATHGFYQVELFTDHGDDGFGLDTLSFEVA